MRGEKDMLFIIVGRKTGMELNETFTLRNIRAVRYDFGSRTVVKISLTLRRCANDARVFDVEGSRKCEEDCSG